MERGGPLPQTAGRSIAIVAAFAVIGAACGPRTGEHGAPSLAGGPGERTCPPPAAGDADTLRAAVAGELDPRHAPAPESRAEAIVFRLLYATLVRIDCTGRAYADLAESWSVEPSGRRWTLRIRRDARFWNGAPVTADAVRASWVAYEGAVRLARSAGLPPDSIHVLDPHTLVLAFREPRPDVLAILAHPSLAVVRPHARSAWPVGAGEYRIDEPPGFGRRLPGRVRLRALAPSEGRPSVIEIHPGVEDGRDLIDRGIDVLVTDRSDAVQYAVARERYRPMPLVWDRVYVLVVPHGLAPAAGDPAARAPGGPPPGGLPELFRELLRRDVVPADHRPTARPGWWMEARGCVPPVSAEAEGVAPSTRDVRRAVVYRRGDPVGRAIAERLVAVAAPGVTSAPEDGAADTVRAALRRLFPSGMPDRAIADSTRNLAAGAAAGSALAFVLDVPATPLWPCEQGGWLHGRAVHPIVETRAYAIVREASVGPAVDVDGTPVLGGPMRGSGR